MEEICWQHGMEEYRAVQQLVREGRYQEAMERAHQALLTGGLGRRNAARLNSLICWIAISGLQEPSPAAILHGEEAVRLAELCSDAWIRCEALARLIPAYCQVGDLVRAERACEALAKEMGRNELVIPGGLAALWLLRALVALAQGEMEQACRCLDHAESLAAAEPELAERVREHRLVITAFQSPGREGGAEAPARVRSLWLEGDGDRAAGVRACALAALLAESRERAVAQAHARDGLQRAIAIGRADLVRLVRSRLAHLLEG